MTDSSQENCPKKDEHYTMADCPRCGWSRPKAALVAVVPHFDGECDRCGCPREWRTWGDCACGLCPDGCTPSKQAGASSPEVTDGR